MTFTDDVWQQGQPILQAIYTHPFIEALGSGALDKATFNEYMLQDALYLGDYSHALAALASRASESDEVIFWAQSSQRAIVAERALHANHVAIDSGEMSPTCRAYPSFLLSRAALRPYEVGAAAALPCFWIYQDVGERLLGNLEGRDDHPYSDWISLYGDEAFAESTRHARSIIDRLADGASESVREEMRKAWLVAARYEWMFWDAAWRHERWAVREV